MIYTYCDAEGRVSNVPFKTLLLYLLSLPTTSLEPNGMGLTPFITMLGLFLLNSLLLSFCPMDFSLLHLPACVCAIH